MNDPQEAGTQQQQIRIGFEAVLDKFVPNWKEESEDPKVRNAIEFSRAIYLQGLTDASVFINSALVSLSEGHNWLLASAQTVAVGVQPPAPAPVVVEEVAPAEQKLAKPLGGFGDDARTSARGETQHLTIVDTLGAVPVQSSGVDPVFVKNEGEFNKVFGKGGTHDGAGASGDWARDEGPNPAKFANDTSTTSAPSADTHYTTSSHTNVSHHTSDSSAPSAGGDSGGSCGGDSGGSCSSD